MLGYLVPYHGMVDLHKNGDIQSYLAKPILTAASKFARLESSWLQCVAILQEKVRCSRLDSNLANLEARVKMG